MLLGYATSLQCCQQEVRLGGATSLPCHADALPLPATTSLPPLDSWCALRPPQAPLSLSCCTKQSHSAAPQDTPGQAALQQLQASIASRLAAIGSGGAAGADAVQQLEALQGELAAFLADKGKVLAEEDKEAGGAWRGGSSAGAACAVCVCQAGLCCGQHAAMLGAGCWVHCATRRVCAVCQQCCTPSLSTEACS